MRLLKRALVGVMSTLLLATIGTVVAAPAGHAADAQDQVGSTSQLAKVNEFYNCVVPRFGQTKCSDQFGIGRGRTVRICLAASRHGADFRLIDSRLGRVGKIAHLQEGECVRVWTNHTGQRRSAHFNAGAKSTFRFNVTIEVIWFG